MGISFDISKILDNVYVSARAFKKLRNLRFLRIFKTKVDNNVRVHVPENMDFPPRLRLLRWDEYPSKCLPPTFSLKYLVDLDLRDNQLETLWQGTQVYFSICLLFEKVLSRHVLTCLPVLCHFESAPCKSQENGFDIVL